MQFCVLRKFVPHSRKEVLPECFPALFQLLLELASDFLNGADIVLTATDDRELNQKIVSACRMRKILVNTADDKSLCDFYFPAVTEKDGVVIGMNSGGKSPKTVRKVREYLEKYR